MLLCGAYAFCFALWATVASVYRVETAHLDPLQLVLVGTVLEGACLLCQVPTGMFADATSRKRSIVIGLVLIGVGLMLEGSFASFGTILLAQVLWGVSATFMDGAQEAWIADEIGEARAGAAYLRGAQAGQVGTIAGALGSVALGSVRLPLPMLLGGALLVFLAWTLWVLMPEVGFTPTARTERPSWDELRIVAERSRKLLHARPLLLSILGIGAIAGMASEGFDRLAAAHFLRDLGLPPLWHFQPVTWFGVMQIGTMGLSLLATELVRRRVDTGSARALVRLLLSIDALLVAAVLGFAVAGSFALALAAFWSVSLLRQVNTALYMAWLNTGLNSRVRATVLSMAGLADAGGQIIGGPIVGLIGNLASIRAAIVATGALLSPALLLFARVLRSQDATPAGGAEAVGTLALDEAQQFVRDER